MSQALKSSGLDPLRLELEITEGVLIRDAARTLDALRRIRLCGVTIALDDFGTGYSSLSTLRAFPFDRLKVDRSFVKDLACSQEASAIVHAVIGLAHGLALPVIAEGVESSQQLDILKKAGCAEIQGYLVGKPQPMAMFSETVWKLMDERFGARAGCPWRRGSLPLRRRCGVRSRAPGGASASSSQRSAPPPTGGVGPQSPSGHRVGG